MSLLFPETEPAKGRTFDYEYPKVTIIVPAYQCAQSINTTLESVLIQDYPDYEILVIDAGPNDRTAELIKGFRSDRVQIYSVSSSRRYEMLNKGITQARGEYLNFLFPGDFYITVDTLKSMMAVALESNKPHMVYCGTLLRDGKKEVKVLNRPFSVQLLKQGQQPTSLQSMWFKKETFKIIGKFDPGYSLRGGFDLLCRLSLIPSLKWCSTTRVLTDYDMRWVTKRLVLLHFWETMHAVKKYFGFWSMVQWLIRQKDTGRFLKLWSHSAKTAFLGK